MDANGSPVAHESGERVEDRPPGDRVEAGDDLVTDQHTRPGRQGAGQRGTLEFAAGQPAGATAYEVFAQAEAGSVVGLTKVYRAPHGLER
ncbi:hypothetical protein KBY55_04765 [Streptomyces sp. b94]|nr:hypothetical protein [Streptomyces sp. b94]